GATGGGNRAAVHLAQPTVALQVLQITTDRHVRHPEAHRQFADPDSTAALQFGKDQIPALAGQHVNPFQFARRTTATPPPASMSPDDQAWPVSRSTPSTGSARARSPWFTAQTKLTSEPVRTVMSNPLAPSNAGFTWASAQARRRIVASVAG